MNLEKLQALGKTWQKDGMHRIYINNLPHWYGLDCTFYGTGNVSSAFLDGAKLANGKATKLLHALDYGAIWFDVPTQEFHSKSLEKSLVEKIVARLKSAIA